VIGRWQIVVHRRWIGIGSNGPWPPFGRNRGCMYRHRLRLGVIELRRWTYKPVTDEPRLKVVERG
jgi:hypothetical protein